MQITLPAEQVVEAAERALQSMDTEIDIPDDYYEKLEMYKQAQGLAKRFIFAIDGDDEFSVAAEKKMQKYYDELTSSFWANLFTSEYLRWRERNEALFDRYIDDVKIEIISSDLLDCINCSAESFLKNYEAIVPSLSAGYEFYEMRKHMFFCYFDIWHELLTQKQPRSRLEKMKSLKGSVELSYDEYNLIKDYL